MNIVYPDYYPEFRCRASACKNSCCIGWEINIDEQTLEKYLSIRDDIGTRIRDNIIMGDTAAFRLGPDERCPFLNDENLCELIFSGGEELLCQICSDHPRFRNYFTNHIEMGLGLCCEAAAELILSRREIVSLSTDYSQFEMRDDEREFLRLRDEIISILQDRSTPLWERAGKMVERCGGFIPAEALTTWCDELLGLERLDERWGRLLRFYETNFENTNVETFEAYMSGRENEYEQMLVYFVYRHLPGALADSNYSGRAAFAYFAARLMFELGALIFGAKGNFPLSLQAELVRMFSSEIEYSDENLDILFELLE